MIRTAAVLVALAAVLGTGPAAAAQADPADMSDAQLASAIAADCTPGACRLHPTAANVGTRWVPWTCAQVAQIDPPAGNAAWRRAWPKISVLVVSSGRCALPSDTQLARELATLPGATGVPIDPAALDQVVEIACPELISGVTHTVYARDMMRVIRRSGVCTS
jgi:hypothetical protein